MKKFEYQVYQASGLSEKKLEQMGKGGWQLQTVQKHLLNPISQTNTYYFMREIDAPRKPRSRTSTKKEFPAADQIPAGRKRRTG